MSTLKEKETYIYINLRLLINVQLSQILHVNLSTYYNVKIVLFRKNHYNTSGFTEQIIIKQ